MVRAGGRLAGPLTYFGAERKSRFLAQHKPLGLGMTIERAGVSCLTGDSIDKSSKRRRLVLECVLFEDRRKNRLGQRIFGVRRLRRNSEIREKRFEGYSLLIRICVPRRRADREKRNRKHARRARKVL